MRVVLLALLLSLTPSLASAQLLFGVDSTTGRDLEAARQVAFRAHLERCAGQLGRVSVEGGVQLSVSRNGHVTRVTLLGDDDDETIVRRCLRIALGRLVFARARTATTIVGHVTDLAVVALDMGVQVAPDPPVQAPPEHDPFRLDLSSTGTPPPPPPHETMVPHGTVTLSEVPAIADRTAMTRLLHTRTTVLLRCYELALRTNPDVTGALRFEIAVGAGGHLTATAREPFDPVVAACMAAAISRWTIAATDAGADTFELTITLAPARP